MAEDIRNRKPEYKNELNIESLISAPLVAASKANIVMVTGQTRFLLEYCFDKEEGDSSYKPVMIEMVLTQAEIDHTKEPNDPEYVQTKSLTFSLPLLTLVPLNSLVVDKVNVDFNMEITSVTSYDPVGRVGKQKVPLNKQAQLYGRISHDPNDNLADGKKGQNQSQVRSRLKVNINASPLPLPVGVLSIIDLYTKSIQPIPARTKEDNKEIENK